MVPATAVLIRGLKDPDSTVGSSAAITLRNIGPAAKDAIPALTAGLQETDWEVRNAIENALKKIQGK